MLLEATGIGLRRTKNLARGCDRRDFRLSREAVTPALWPPELVERTCGQSETDAAKVAS